MRHTTPPHHTPTSRMYKLETADKGSDCPLSTQDTRPDPKVLTSPERMSEFGRLILRAIERRQSRIP